MAQVRNSLLHCKREGACDKAMRAVSSASLPVN